jgi:7-cyano-7-deazaguanine synthase
MDNSQKNAIVLVSGGMDSLVTAAIANSKKYKELFFLHLNYGQKTQDKELKCFNDISEFYNVKKENREVIDISFLKQIGGSSLTDDSIDVKKYSKEHDGKDDFIPDSYVPFRNTHIISMAVSFADANDIHDIYIGAVYEDSSGYPDCRPEYYEKMNALIKVGTKNQNIEVITPIIHMTKDKIIQEGVNLKAPLEKSWSCYKSNDPACGICDSCALRLRGFQKLNLKDPIEYKERPDYLN